VRYEDEVKHAELALEGLEEPFVRTVEASHWVDLENFYNNERRVLRKSGGVIAANVYPARSKEEPRVNKVLDEFYAAIERHLAPQVFRYVDPKLGYERLPFPFAQGNVTTVDANREEFLKYLRSWSVVQTAIDQGEDPLSERSEADHAKRDGTEFYRSMCLTL
jgi:hypothetical protein